MKLETHIARRHAKRMAELIGGDPGISRPTGELESRYSQADINRLIAAWIRKVEGYLAADYTPYRLTFVSRPLPGLPVAATRKMERAIEAAFDATLIAAPCKPQKGTYRVPPALWFGCPDLSGQMHRVRTRHGIFLSDERRLTIVALVPPSDLACQPYDILVEGEQARFARDPVAWVRAEQVAADAGAIVGDGLRQLALRHCDPDAIIVLPRTATTLPGYQEPAWLSAKCAAESASKASGPRHRRSGQAGWPPSGADDWADDAW